MRSEKAKMLGGELSDPLGAGLSGARLPSEALSDTRGDRQDERARLIRELIPDVGEGAWIEPPFYCGSGTNITLGEKVFFNFNRVILDAAPVRVGSRALFGPSVQVRAATHPPSAAERRNVPEELSSKRVASPRTTSSRVVGARL